MESETFDDTASAKSQEFLYLEEQVRALRGTVYQLDSERRQQFRNLIGIMLALAYGFAFGHSAAKSGKKN